MDKVLKVVHSFNGNVPDLKFRVWSKECIMESSTIYLIEQEYNKLKKWLEGETSSIAIEEKAGKKYFLNRNSIIYSVEYEQKF